MLFELNPYGVFGVGMMLIFMRVTYRCLKESREVQEK